MIRSLVLLATVMIWASPATGQPLTDAQCEKAKAKSDALLTKMKDLEKKGRLHRNEPAAKRLVAEADAHVAVLQQCLNLSVGKALKDIREQAEADCQKRGQPKIGMTAIEVEATCWGKPKRIMTRTTAAGVTEGHEYGPGRTLYYSNGRLHEIVQTRD